MPSRYNQAMHNISNMESVRKTEDVPETQYFMNNMSHPATGKICSYNQFSSGNVPNQDKSIRINALVDELGRLVDGVGSRMLSGTNTIKFINNNGVPSGRDIAYSKSVCNIRQHKVETNRYRFTVGSNRLDYLDKVSRPISDPTTVKCIINSILSTTGAKGLVSDV